MNIRIEAAMNELRAERWRDRLWLALAAAAAMVIVAVTLSFRP